VREGVEKRRNGGRERGRGGSERERGREERVGCKCMRKPKSVVICPLRLFIWYLWQSFPNAFRMK
jgi:hypothetical protein